MLQLLMVCETAKHALVLETLIYDFPTLRFLIKLETHKHTLSYMLFMLTFVSKYWFPWRPE